ncbi:MAG: NAD(P)/FAD-dependent oxidoreductase, partial [Myxococcales bacterium]|nr:NAD(P)/FAD-dependent oxidoreductase [Myxococcales bacterium]
TWDLFRYPGIRSDSDMYTLGYQFRPWREQASIAEGDAILRYLHETADAYDLRRRIRFHHRVTRASWSSDEARWQVTVERGDTGETVVLTCSFLFMCSGYYDYATGHAPAFPGVEQFRGRVVHPQQWPEDLDYAGKRVIVIGSGATAVTLVPELAKEAAHVTMLQRSPTYVLSLPAVDRVAKRLRRVLPPKALHFVVRWKNILMSTAFYTLCRKAPKRARALLRMAARHELGRDYDVDTHFNPRYDPWDQRLCVVPDGDLFHAIRDGRVSVVTDTIETFTERGLRVASGAELEADLIVTATGLKMLFMAGMEVEVDGARVDPARCTSYKAMMLSDVPNLALSFGYTNASWTLKSDLTGEYVCRLLLHMRSHGYRRCVPRLRDPTVERRDFLDFSSGYVQRALSSMPKQGSKPPWMLHQNYVLDVMMIRHGRIDDEAMEFAR